MPKQLIKRAINSPLTRYILAGFVVMVLGVQSVLIWQLYDRTNTLQTQTMKDVLVDAARSLNTELVVDPVTGVRSIPAYQVIFPAGSATHMYYRGGGEDTTLWLTDASNQSQAISQLRIAPTLEDVFKEVATVQRCSRQVVVSFAPAVPKDSDDKLTLKDTKKLKDGRTAYVYQNECPYGAEGVLTELKGMQSF